MEGKEVEGLKEEVRKLRGEVEMLVVAVLLGGIREVSSPMKRPLLKQAIDWRRWLEDDIKESKKGLDKDG